MFGSVVHSMLRQTFSNGKKAARISENEKTGASKSHIRPTMYRSNLRSSVRMGNLVRRHSSIHNEGLQQAWQDSLKGIYLVLERSQSLYATETFHYKVLLVSTSDMYKACSYKLTILERINRAVLELDASQHNDFNRISTSLLAAYKSLCYFIGLSRRHAHRQFHSLRRVRSQKSAEASQRLWQLSELHCTCQRNLFLIEKLVLMG